MAEILLNDFTTQLVADLPESLGVGGQLTVRDSVPVSAVGGNTRVRIGTEILLVTVTAPTVWTIVSRAVEDSDRFPARLWRAGTTVDAVLTAASVTTIVGQPGPQGEQGPQGVQGPAGPGYPDQTGQGGKYLTTNGSSPSWGVVDLSNFVTSSELDSTLNNFVTTSTTQIITGVKTFNSLLVTSTNTGTVPCKISGAAGQTANIAEFYGAQGRSYVQITKDGGLQFRDYYGNDVGYIGPAGNFTQWTNSLIIGSMRTGNLSGDTAAMCVNNGPGSRFFSVGAGNANLTSPSQTKFCLDTEIGCFSTFGDLDRTTSFLIRSVGTTKIGCTVRGIASQTANLQEWQSSTGTALSAVKADGSYKPSSLSDSAASNNSLYYSTTQGKLVYKDSAGVVNNLY